MITLLEKNGRYKKIVTSKADIAGSLSSRTYKTLVLPSDGHGRIDLHAERSIYTAGDIRAHCTHVSIVKELCMDGWKVLK